LLPRGAAWRLPYGSPIRRFFDGFGPTLDRARDAADAPINEAFPETTTSLATWEKQFGLRGGGTDSERRAILAAEWQATGGQSVAYITQILQTAGFDVAVYEYWSAEGPPAVVRDPRDYTEQPLIGTVQCTPQTYQYLGQPQCSDGLVGPDDRVVHQFQCDAFLQNDPHYLVNKLLTNEAPPPVPDDPDTWPYFLYVGASTGFGDIAEIPLSRRAEFERLLLKLRPLQNWIVLLVQYVDDGPTPGGTFAWDEPGRSWDDTVWP